MSPAGNEHPSAVQLEAYAVGHETSATRAHVEGCASCARYVDEIRHNAQAFAQDDVAAARFVGAVRAKQEAARDERSRRWRAGAWKMGAAVAFAAGTFLFLQFGPLSTPGHVVPSEGPVRFKGGTQVTVIVEHAGLQSRQPGPLELEPGDRIRLEIALDHDERVAAGVLSNAGEWADLQAPTVLKAGTHYSEQSIQFDQEVPTGVILVGPAEAIEQARKNRDFPDSVVSIRLRAHAP
ncbi:hypothetical protein LVJ94_16840 [Pendulispora rubella]|uniref:DUF4115 domain-containing protein n=1 Tax=Pendulispora rubella TaxID=2741070 RepID=A0ABZ2LIA3_9BACT